MFSLRISVRFFQVTPEHTLGPLERNEIFPALSVNKGSHSHQQLQIAALKQWTGEPWGNWIPAKKNTCYLAVIRLATPYRWALRKLRMWNTRYRPRRAEAQIKGVISAWAQTLASSHTWKSTKLLNPRFLVFFNEHHILMFRPLALLFQNSCITWLYSLPAQSSFSELWNAVSWAAVLILPK